MNGISSLGMSAAMVKEWLIEPISQKVVQLMLAMVMTPGFNFGRLSSENERLVF
jgi:hypothetical protein